MELKKVTTEEGQQLVEAMVRDYNDDPVFQGIYYVAVDDSGEVLGCVGLKRRAWFMTEIRHLYVRPEHRNRGIGKFLSAEVLKRVKAPLACTTFKVDDEPCKKILVDLGFMVQETFVNPGTGNTIHFATVKVSNHVESEPVEVDEEDCLTERTEE